mgnify:CR=1 FL=1
MTHRAAAESVGPDLTRLAGAAGSAFSRPLHHIIFTISHKQAVAGCSACAVTAAVAATGGLLGQPPTHRAPPRHDPIAIDKCDTVHYHMSIVDYYMYI